MAELRMKIQKTGEFAARGQMDPTKEASDGVIRKRFKIEEFWIKALGNVVTGCWERQGTNRECLTG